MCKNDMGKVNKNDEMLVIKAYKSNFSCNSIAKEFKISTETIV